MGTTAGNRLRWTGRAVLLLGLGLGLPLTAAAKSEPDLGARIWLDGLALEYEPDESLFGESASGAPHESKEDSRWGEAHDLNQIRLTWDRRFLYLAAEGVISGDALLVLVDAAPHQGLMTMNNVTQWTRHIDFSSAFTPDFLAATPDGGSRAQLLMHVSSTPGQLVNLPHAVWFLSAATFQQEAVGRATELMIPWTTVFANDERGPAVVRDTLMDGVFQRIVFVPPFTTLRIAGLVTGGDHMSSGPDVAPNNAAGCPDTAAGVLLVDNWVELLVDADGDGLPDMNASPRERVVYANDSVPAAGISWGRLKAGYRGR